MIEVLKRRRSARSFLNKEIEKEKVDLLIKAALLSPSSKSRCPWEFIVINDKKIIEKLALAKEHGSAFLKNAPLAITVITDSSKSDVWIEDASIAAIIIQLEAEKLELGSCWIQLRMRKTKDGENSSAYVKKLLNIPDNYEAEAIIAVGYKKEERPPYTDSDLMYDKVHFNGFKD